jgi:DNA-binding CsgD family transcriptional regulator
MLRQSDLSSAALLLAECAEALGWNLAAFHSDIHQPTLPRAGGEFIGTAMGWRAKTVNEWVTQGLARSCPIGRHCSETTEPFLWDCDSDSVQWRREPPPPEQRAVLRHYSNRASLGSVHLLSHTFLRQLDRLQGARDECPAVGSLTPRELECLTWAARGRTTEEIAALLHRSSETIEFHLSNAMLKLAANNRAHAVAIACVRGMIRDL